MNRFLLILLETGITMSKPETIQQKTVRLLFAVAKITITQAEIDRLAKRFEHDNHFKMDCMLVQLAVKEAAQPTLWDYIEATTHTEQKGLEK